MRTAKLGDLEVARIGLGAMGMSHGFTGENFKRNVRIADQVKVVADQVGATPAQVGLAWLLTKGNDIVPIPGTKRVSRVEENIAADAVELTPGQIATLDALPVAEGGHHTDEQMKMIER